MVIKEEVGSRNSSMGIVNGASDGVGADSDKRRWETERQWW